MNNTRGNMSEPRPHIFGAHALHYRQGSAMGNTEIPPTWSPEMAHDASYPYTLAEYLRDVTRWMSLTKVSVERQGALLAMAIGGAGRTVADEIPADMLQNGAQADLGDGVGNVYRSGPQLLFHALGRKFPDNQEALMLRAGLEFFSFTPRRDETPQLVFIRFDNMLERANTLADLGISYPFRAWMLLSLLRLNPRKWSEYLKDMGHRFPRTMEEYQNMKDNIVREKTLESQMGTMGHDGRSAGQTMGSTFFEGSQDDGIPLYLCPGSPAHTAGPSQPGPPRASYLQLQDR